MFGVSANQADSITQLPRDDATPSGLLLSGRSRLRGPGSPAVGSTLDLSQLHAAVNGHAPANFRNSRDSQPQGFHPPSRTRLLVKLWQCSTADWKEFLCGRILRRIFPRFARMGNFSGAWWST